MPRTRAHLDRDDKVDQIVTAAQRQLLEGGFSSLSVAAIARELGLAQNALYWYFPSRDHLLLAALQRIIGEVLPQKPKGKDPLARVMWFADRFDEFHALRAAVHERARTSPLVAEFEAAFNDRVHALAADALEETVPADQVAVTADALLAMVEGVLMRQLPRRRRDAVLRFGYDRLTAP